MCYMTLINYTIQVKYYKLHFKVLYLLRTIGTPSMHLAARIIKYTVNCSNNNYDFTIKSYLIQRHFPHLWDFLRKLTFLLSTSVVRK